MQPVCFELTENDTSLEKTFQDGNKVILIGAGLLKYPGHPKGNQQYHNKFKITKSFKTYTFTHRLKYIIA